MKHVNFKNTSIVMLVGTWIAMTVRLFTYPEDSGFAEYATSIGGLLTAVGVSVKMWVNKKKAGDQ